MKAFWKKTRREPAIRPVVRTPWSRFLDHAMDCAACRSGERCVYGGELHNPVRAALAAAAP